jgi:hypothetical protein
MTLRYHDQSLSAACNCTDCTPAYATDDRPFIDGRPAPTDPTGTRVLRNRFRIHFQLKWNALRVLVRRILTENDLLQLNAGGLLPIGGQAVVNGGNKVVMFTQWIDNALRQVVYHGDNSELRAHLQKAYDDGLAFAERQSGLTVTVASAQHTLDTLVEVTAMEVQGIIDAVSQGAVRTVGAGLLAGDSARAIARNVLAVIDKTGANRTNGLVEFAIVSAFTNATLDYYAAAKIEAVGVVAEMRKQSVAGDAMYDASRRVIRPGSRSRTTEGGPSARTIRRIRAAERKIEALGTVNIINAEDEKVCPVCERLAKGGPYPINTARGLIPNHPRCLPGDAEITTRHAVKAWSKRHYESWMVTIKTGLGHTLTCTPNHPIMTTNGYKPAGGLQIGDTVLCDDGQSPNVHTHAIRKPTKIGMLAIDDWRRYDHVRVGPMDFHGDGGGSKIAHVFSRAHRDDLANGIKRTDYVTQRDSMALFQQLITSGNHYYVANIVSVDSYDWSGLVYNIETDSGYYSAQGIVTSNCRCAFVPYVEQPGEDDDADFISELRPRGRGDDEIDFISEIRKRR